MNIDNEHMGSLHNIKISKYHTYVIALGHKDHIK